MFVEFVVKCLHSYIFRRQYFCLSCEETVFDWGETL